MLSDSSGPVRILGHRRIDLGGWMQERTYKGERDDLHAAGPEDRSAFHSSLSGSYDARCSWCYLGIGHTENAHVKAVGE